jgi:hypothetical protein
MMKPLITKCADGSVLVEFIDKDWRFYLSIDKKSSDSSWGFCTREGKSDCGELSPQFLDLFEQQKLTDLKLRD